MLDHTDYAYRNRNRNRNTNMESFSGDVRLGLKHPTGVTASGDVLFPSYEAQTPAYAAAISATANAAKTLLAPAELAGNLTLNVAAHADLMGGEELVVKILSDASVRTVTLGTGITGPALTTVASKTHVARFMYDGVAFVQTSPWTQID